MLSTRFAFSNNYNLVSRLLKTSTRNMHLLNEKAFVNGEWVSAENNRVFDVKDPATTNLIATAPDMSVKDTEKAIDAAYRAFYKWENTTAKYRSDCLRRWFNLLVENRESLAKIITAESGKPMVESLAEIQYGNSFVEFFSEEARRIDGEIVESASPNKKYFVQRQPIGVAGLITPWNFPFAMITRKAGAAIAAGCTCVVRPAEDTPFTALAIAQLAQEAGLPDGVLNVVTSDRKNAPAIGRLLCKSPKVAGISFTGSTQVGKILYEQCAEGVKRLELELGGNAPFIVYKSANIPNAVKGALASKFRNCGQTCVASNRFLVQHEVYDHFVSSLLEEVRKLRVGCGSQPDVNIGPLINAAQVDKVCRLVRDAVSKGGDVLTGGRTLPQLGELFYEPTIIADISDKMEVYTEEVFGPVINVIRFETEEESIAIANNSRSGLAGYFYSEDLAQIFRVSRALEVGMCGVNEGIISAAEVPFGGVKESGLGREGGKHGIEDFTYVKYVCIGNL